jgi:hypothetical protein
MEWMMCRAGAVVCPALARRMSESGGLAPGCSGPAASVPLHAGTVRSPTDSGPAAPACVLRGSRPITGKTLPTQPRRQRLRRNAGVGPGTSRRSANRRRRARGVGSVNPSPPGPSRVSPGGKRGVVCPSLGG